MNLPILFEDRMKKLLGKEYETFLQCYEKPHFSGVRVNTLKITPEEFTHICPFTAKRIPWIANGYYTHREDTVDGIQPSKHPYYYAGMYYIQEPSAMTPASLLPVEKGDKVLDICAAPGGKSTELGARLQGEGVLVSNDISNSRAKALLKNIELLGIRNALVLSEAPNKLMDYFPEYFDKILVDAPCSGEGMFRKSPAIMKNWEQYGVDYYNKLQKEIVQFAARMLKPGGYMLYSTCTFSPEEDEGTVSYLMEQFPEFHVVNAIPDENTQRELEISYEGFTFGRPEWAGVTGQRSGELKHCLRLWPHKINGEGHFVALLQKGGTESGSDKENVEGSAEECGLYGSTGIRTYDRGSNKNNDKSSDKNRNRGSNQNNHRSSHSASLSDEAMEFLDKLGMDISREQLTVRDDRVYLSPKGLPELKGLRILRQGLLIGEMKKQRFEPSQALANALQSSEYDKIINLNGEDPRVIRYLKCESIELKENYKDGWYLVCVDGFPLGWSKITKNNFKNKYLPGWRWV